MKTKYVAGFLFRYNGKEVALIDKIKPAFLFGKLNAIGGKIEDLGEGRMEDPLIAIQREFEEETGAKVLDWEEFCILNGKTWEVRFFKSFGDHPIKTMEEEQVNWYPVSRLEVLPIVRNLKWLIPMALDTDNITATAFDPSL